MADIQERIKNLGKLFKEMQVKQIEGVSVIYVVVLLPQRWIIDETIREKYGVDVLEGKEEPGEYYFCADASVGFDKVFDAIDFCVRVNKEAMERTQIFQEKLNKLKELFGNEEISIEELKTLDFTFQKKKQTARKPKKTQIEEIAEQEMEDGKNE